ncbi:unnamed protein product [Plutella xylostella]|uniref:(diamondback moth) hypothetical protein n=1 Tax=Plutella xylostella TaxID=51655 RepID=A0A8S4G096_PLUXY|nr:unnamed protein product [Plutella xylostella]
MKRFRTLIFKFNFESLSSQFSFTNFCRRQHSRVMTSTKSISDMGYAFNTGGQLRKLEANGEPGDSPFQFNISDNHQECQKNYEELGEAVTDYVYKLLEEKENLVKLPVPTDSKAGTFVYTSRDYDKKDTLLVLIHGSGVVRAGQWARSLIINDSLNSGTQIPYIRKAIAKDYGVIILNTNDNYTSEGDKIPHSSNPEEHAIYVWKTYIASCSASSVAIVAHSYGGVVTLALADKIKDFEKKVKAIAFTDSVHGFSQFKITKHLKQIAKNWVASGEPLDTPMKTSQNDIVRVSAGHPKHEMTSHACIESVFKFIDEKLTKA